MRGCQQTRVTSCARTRLQSFNRAIYLKASAQPTDAIITTSCIQIQCWHTSLLPSWQLLNFLAQLLQSNTLMLPCFRPTSSSAFEPMIAVASCSFSSRLPVWLLILNNLNIFLLSTLLCASTGCTTHTQEIISTLIMLDFDCTCRGQECGNSSLVDTFFAQSRATR